MGHFLFFKNGFPHAGESVDVVVAADAVVFFVSSHLSSSKSNSPGFSPGSGGRRRRRDDVRRLRFAESPRQWRNFELHGLCGCFRC